MNSEIWREILQLNTFRRFCAFVLTRRDSPFAGERAINGSTQRDLGVRGTGLGPWERGRMMVRAGETKAPTASGQVLGCWRTNRGRDPTEFPCESRVRRHMKQVALTPLFRSAASSSFSLRAPPGSPAGRATRRGRPPAEAGRWGWCVLDTE